MSLSTREEKRAFWREHVAAQEASGLSGAAYCREHGLQAKGLYYWQRVLREAGDLDSGGRLGSSQEGAGPRALFAEVRVGTPQGPGPDACASGVEVRVGGGRLVRVARGFDAETLQRVVAALEENAC